MIMATPNLFEFATSELSQDAFICWLLSWAKKDYKTGSDKQQALNQLATYTLAMFFDKAGKTLPDTIEQIVVRRQVSNIDILCVINETYCVLIEDKVGSIQHSNQLARYKQFVMDGHTQTFTENKIVPIYLQTHDQSDYQKVRKEGFYPVTRSDLLKVFDDVPENTVTHSDIYENFYDYLQSIEKAVQSFNHLPVKSWGHRAWIGLFKYLQTQLGEGSWGYVANPSGGFMGFWGLGHRVDNMDVYLQLEQDKVCFKMSMVDKENRSKVRNQLNKLFVKEASNFDLKVTKPERFGSGRHMTFAILHTDVINKHNDKPIDLIAVDELIIKLQKFIHHSVDEFKKQSASH